MLTYLFGILIFGVITFMFPFEKKEKDFQVNKKSQLEYIYLEYSQYRID